MNHIEIIEKRFNDLSKTVFSCNESSDDYERRMLELGNIFRVQFYALIRIKQQSFFPTIALSFERVMLDYLEMIAGVKSYAEELEASICQKAVSSSSRSSQPMRECLIRSLKKRRNSQERSTRIRKEMIVRIASIKRQIVKDSYAFIKSFDNALQGYFNSDRQFLEFPGHHVSLYDLPVKLGTVYIKFIDETIAAFKSTEKFSYLLCPEPFDAEGAQVKRLLEDDYEVCSAHTLTCDSAGKNLDDSTEKKRTQLCLISVPFNSLFKPNELCIVLAHEISHYISRELRLVSTRNQLIIDICIDQFEEAFMLCLPYYLSGTFVFDAKRKCKKARIIEEIARNYREDFEDSIKRVVSREEEELAFLLLQGNPEQDTLVKSGDICRTSFTQKRLRNCIYEAAWNVFRNSELSTMHYLSKLELPEARMNLIRSEFIETVTDCFGKSYECIFYIVQEAVSDILAIKLLDVKKADYINLIDAEIALSISKGTTLLSKFQSLRREMVSIVFGWRRKLTDSSYEYLSKPVCNKLIGYLKRVRNNFTCNGNDARKMYENLTKDQISGDLQKYML